jgi:hypothetical protein
MLTAAHCLTDRNGVFDVSQTIVSSNYLTNSVLSTYVDIAVASDGYYIFPGWNGFAGGDIAVLKLATAAPSGIQQFDIYRGRDEVGQTFKVVGAGTSALSGATGITSSKTNQRFARNRVDAAVESFGPITGSQLLYDFDSGSPNNDTSCYVLGVCDLGVGTVGTEGQIEGIGSFGDSGGALFINGKIAGVTSYILSPGAPIDVDNQLNSTWGELSGATRVSSYAQFIDDAVAGRIAPAVRGQAVSRSTTSGNVALISYNYTDGDFVKDTSNSEAESVPEPTSALGLLAASLSGAGLLSRKRKGSSKPQKSV